MMKERRISGFVSLKGSGDLFHTADIVLHLTRDKDETPDILDCDIVKHKFHSCNSFAIKGNFAKGTFEKHENKKWLYYSKDHL